MTSTHTFKRDRRGGINMSDPHNAKILQELECKRWLRDHPGRTAVEYRKLLAEPNWEQNEIRMWRTAKAEASDRAMRRAYRRDHPGEAPLPEHLCALDHPYPGFKRWAAKAKRWLDRYDRH
ncbi:hypothetical protein [Bradyrhizobium erythrophlei]|uniref:Uncharacterized protein n=1 Tax=Bradyrhizobium erythrophlei TaxID=1437360 RepID=A0A1M5I8V0_9BRAD|nr:hypothetical protein [Bradyrhizobium erythrophlei]SHG24784.1 hypothetical protein SAMN05444169_1388 [Bradyrhizobium erythrophlei]